MHSKEDITKQLAIYMLGLSKIEKEIHYMLFFSPPNELLK